jgi:hypothetical protein
MISSSPITPPPEQFTTCRYDWSKADTEAMEGDPAFRCILELRARIEALEATQRPPHQDKLDRLMALNADDGEPIVLPSSRAARRPSSKPPSDKELALNALSLIMSQQKGMFDGKPFNTIRRVLEALPND